MQKMTTEIESETPSIIGLGIKLFSTQKLQKLKIKKPTFLICKISSKISTDLASLVTKNDIKTAFDYMMGNFK